MTGGKYAGREGRGESESKREAFGCVRCAVRTRRFKLVVSWLRASYDSNGGANGVWIRCLCRVSILALHFHTAYEFQ